MDGWVQDELGGADLGDARLNRRLRQIVQALSAQPETSVPQASGSWAATKATYRFWDHAALTADALLAPHVAQTVARCQAQPRVLAVQDTSVFNFSGHPATRGLGPSSNGQGQGLLVHTALAVSLDGVPLGVLHQATWTRTATRPNHRRNRTTAAKESQRWLTALQTTQTVLPTDVGVITVADREADLYDLFAQPRRPGSDLLIRASQNRRVDAAEGWLWDAIRAVPVAGELTVAVPRHDDQPARTARVSVRWRTLAWQPPRHRKGGRAGLAPLPLQIVLAEEVDPPSAKERLRWLLVTTLPVTSWADAVQVLTWYALRWRVERFHFVLKSGCQIEQLQLAHVDRLTRALATYSIVAWRLLWLTYAARQAPEQPCTVGLTTAEWQVLHQTQLPHQPLPAQPPSLQQAVRWLAQLGGFLARTGDGDPGLKTLWRGLRRLADLLAGWQLAYPVPAAPT